MNNLAKRVAAQYIRGLIGYGSRKVDASHMDVALDQFDELVDAMAGDSELMGDVIETLVNMGELTYHDGAFYYREKTRLASERVYCPTKPTKNLLP